MYSYFRCKDLDKKGILYVGSGVSGGEEGARYGPSLMPGGNAAAWPYIKDIFQVNQEVDRGFNLEWDKKRTGWYSYSELELT